LDREFGAADVRRISGLEGDTQINQLRELLGGDFENSGSRLDGSDSKSDTESKGPNK